jgi:hypothetical protein
MKRCGSHRNTNEEPEAVKVEGWRNSFGEAYTGKSVGHRAARTRLKVDIAP